MTDLTERLAAIGWTEHGAREYLPLLLSEPELVAKLPDAVRLSVLTPRERAVLKLGEAIEAYEDAPDRMDDRDEDDRAFREWLSVGNDAVLARRAALAEVRALTPEGKDGK